MKGQRVVIAALSLTVAGGVAYLVQAALLARRLKTEGLTLQLPIIGAQHLALDGGGGGGGSSIVLPADVTAMQARMPYVAGGVAVGAGLLAFAISRD